MRILDLYLRAFGPFTDRHLDLSGGQPGLHLIFGPNEAGKSSALRALRALLFGIPERTADDFLHSRQNLRVGARLRAPNGDELLCFRKKGRKNTLLDSAGNALPEAALAALLGGIDERLFEHLFGVDHDTLVAGGQALLAERGREAEALFGAGLGGLDIHAVLKQFDQEANELFAPRASTRAINLQLNQLAELDRRQREASLSARHWDDARKAVEQARQRLRDMDAVLAQATRQRSRLERIRRTLPNLARRAQLLEQLAAAGDAPDLAEDFGRRRELAMGQRALALATQTGARARLAAIRGKADALAIREELLAEAEVIDALLESLGSHRKAATDRARLVTDRTVLEAQSAALLAQARPELTLADAPQLRPLLNRRRRVTELGGSREALAAAVVQAQAKFAETARQLAAVQTALALLPASQSATALPLDALRRAVDDARRVGDLDRASADAAVRLQRHGDECQRDLAALGLWRRDLAALRLTALPGIATIERFYNEFKDLEDSKRTLEKTRADTLAERQRIDETLHALQLAGAVPSENDLEQARAQRDRLWRQLRHGGSYAAPPVAATHDDPASPSPDRFESAMASADDIADRLRRESRRVHDQAAALARRESRDRRLDELEQLLETHCVRETALQQDWQSLWSPTGIVPLPAREMQQWLNGAMRLRELAAQGDDLRASVAQLEETRKHHATVLASALNGVAPALFPDGEPASGARETLAPLLNQAEAQLAARLETARRRALLEQELTALQETARRSELEVAATVAAQSRWADAWTALMAELGLPDDASPGDASDHLKTLDDCLNRIHDATRLAGRIDGIDADATRFRAQASALLARLAPELAERPVEEAVPQLHQRLVRQREDRSRRDELLRQAHGAQEEIQQSEAVIESAAATLAELCREARCADPDQLAAVEQQARTRRGLRQQLQDVESALTSAGDGLGIDALQAEAGSIDYDVVLAELSALESRLEVELRPRQASLLEDKLNAERTFADMTGNAVAATLAEESQQTLAILRVQAERYIRLKLAARILRETIERFRRAHRDPILARASSYFAQLTGAAFQSIETDFAESEPILVGRRATGERLPVEGMSTGTRDQLYLALRLANLERRLHAAEPLPFIVDDILIQFDDARAQQTLGALLAFSAKTQVILFTHHQRVVEQARTLDPGGTQVLVHTL